MWQGIQASGRPVRHSPLAFFVASFVRLSSFSLLVFSLSSAGQMILTVEGSPPAAVITHGGYGNAKRVGHDISPSWGSMISLVDIGAGM